MLFSKLQAIIPHGKIKNNSKGKNKMKIYLSKETVKRLVENDFDRAGASSDEEAEIFDKCREQLNERRRDDKNEFSLTADVAECVISALDWYCTAYYNDKQDGLLEFK